MDIDDFSQNKKLDHIAHYEGLFRLYIFADRYSIDGLMKHLLNGMENKLPVESPQADSWANLATMPTSELIEYVWENQSDKSPLRSLIVKMFVANQDSKFFHSQRGKEFLKGCPELALDLVPALMAKRHASKELAWGGVAEKHY